MEGIASELAGESPRSDTRITSTPITTISSFTNRVVSAFNQFRISLSGNEQQILTRYSEPFGQTWTPFQFSLIYPQQLYSPKTEIMGFRFNLIYGKNNVLYGFDLGLINEITEELMGYQLGIYNYVGNVYGVQKGLLNIGENVYGLQFGIINISQNLTGVQIGILNFNIKGHPFPFMPIINIGF